MLVRRSVRWLFGAGLTASPARPPSLASGVLSVLIDIHAHGACDNGDLTAGIGLDDAQREQIHAGNAILVVKLTGLQATAP